MKRTRHVTFTRERWTELTEALGLYPEASYDQVLSRARELRDLAVVSYRETRPTREQRRQQIADMFLRAHAELRAEREVTP